MEILTKEQFEEQMDKASGGLKEPENFYMVFKDVDGNYRGCCFKNGTFINVRDVGPETVLQLLLTHDGR